MQQTQNVPHAIQNCPTVRFTIASVQGAFDRAVLDELVQEVDEEWQTKQQVRRIVASLASIW